MAKPIAQTFSINELNVQGVFLTKIRLYFKTKSSSKGIALQLRECDNGVPTNRIVPYSKIHKAAADINISDDATEYTDFTFSDPVFVKTALSYAFVLLPDGGNDEYQIWTAQLGGKDVSTDSQKPVDKNNEVGTLFISSNDIQWTPIQEEDIKFEIFRADFESSGNIIFKEPNVEYLIGLDQSATVNGSEIVVVGNGDIKTARLTFSSATGTWSNGELVYQSNGSSNTATGILYFSNSTTVCVQNITGSFVVSNTITGNISGAYATMTAISQNVISSSNTTISVPHTAVYSVNDQIYILPSNTSLTAYAKLGTITAINSTSHTITLDSNVHFTSSNCYIGKQVGFGGSSKLQARINNSVLAGEGYLLYCSGSTANAATNFTQYFGNRIIGDDTGTHWILDDVIDRPYEALSIDLKPIIPPFTDLSISVKGFENDASFTEDSNYTDISLGKTYEFLDKQRTIVSRSNSFYLPAGREGNSSVVSNVSFTTSDSKISPYFDKNNMDVVVLHNLIANSNGLEGYWLEVSNTSGDFNTNEYIQLGSNSAIYGSCLFTNSTMVIVTNPTSNMELQANVTMNTKTGNFVNNEIIYQTVSSVNTAYGYVISSNSTVVRVGNVEGKFVTTANVTGASSGATANITSIVQGNYLVGATSSATANIVSVRYFQEALGNGPKLTSRYISKSTTLADGQDSEDLKVYLTAYRPPLSDVYVYAKFLNSSDPQSIDRKSWSRLKRLSADTFYSSAENLEDYIELEYSVPFSQEVLANTTLPSISGNLITVSTVEGFSNNSYIYLFDSDKNALNVRKITNIANNTTIQIDTNATFAFTGNTSIGKIPDLEYKDCAFIFVHPNVGVANTITYSTLTDKIYTTYKTFAVKLVPVSEYPYVVPKIDDMRAICLQT